MKNTNEKIHDFLNKNTKAVTVENVYKPKTNREMKAIKKIVAEFNKLCKMSNYKQAGELARSHKTDFIEMIENGGNEEMIYAYRVCSIFNMRQTDCFNLKFCFNEF